MLFPFCCIPVPAGWVTAVSVIHKHPTLRKTTLATTTLEEHVATNAPLCLLVLGPDLRWPTREWTFLQQSVTSCPRAPPTSSPAPWAPAARIATASGKAAPPTTSKPFRVQVPLSKFGVCSRNVEEPATLPLGRRDPLCAKRWK